MVIICTYKKSKNRFYRRKSHRNGRISNIALLIQITQIQTVSNKADCKSHSIEAAEQCGGTYVPPVDELSTLTTVLKELAKRKVINYFVMNSKVGENCRSN